MSSRVDTSFFDGKTIDHVDSQAINTLTFVFTDGTYAVLDVENVMPGLYGIFETKRGTVDLKKRKNVEMCEDCSTYQLSCDLITKGDHHGGNKLVCKDRDSCHRRSP